MGILLETLKENTLNTPEKLLKYMEDFKYGYMKKDGSLEHEEYENFFNDYKLQSPSEIMISKTGVCWDQVEFERYIFEKYINLPFNTYYIEQ